MSERLQKLLIFPFGGNARETLMVAIAQNQIKKRWHILGFIDDNLNIKGKTCCGFPVLGSREILDKYPRAKVIAVQGRDNNYWQRKEIIASLQIPVDRWAVLTHPNVAIASDAHVGYNTVLMSGCVVSTGVFIGNHCVVLPNTVLSHESSIGDYTLIGSNVSVSGYVNIGESCYIGTGSKIIQEIKIGNTALVGLGSVVIKPVPPKTVVAGCPAKVLHQLRIVSKGKKESPKNAGC